MLSLALLGLPQSFSTNSVLDSFVQKVGLGIFVGHGLSIWQLRVIWDVTAIILSRGETYDAVHGSFINLMKLENVETLVFLVPASNHFMF